MENFTREGKIDIVLEALYGGYDYVCREIPVFN